MVKRTRNSSNGSVMVRWDLLANDRVIECIDKLLKGEVINQISNSCSLSRIANIICEIRKVIGFDAIENIPLGIGKVQGYKLADDDEVKQKLLQLKDELIKLKRGKSLKS